MCFNRLSDFSLRQYQRVFKLSSLAHVLSQWSYFSTDILFQTTICFLFKSLVQTRLKKMTAFM